jgi:hypothetical protein
MVFRRFSKAESGNAVAHDSVQAYSGKINRKPDM